MSHCTFGFFLPEFVIVVQCITSLRLSLIHKFVWPISEVPDSASDSHRSCFCRVIIAAMVWLFTCGPVTAQRRQVLVTNGFLELNLSESRFRFWEQIGVYNRILFSAFIGYNFSAFWSGWRYLVCHEAHFSRLRLRLLDLTLILILLRYHIFANCSNLSYTVLCSILNIRCIFLIQVLVLTFANQLLLPDWQQKFWLVV